MPHISGHNEPTTAQLNRRLSDAGLTSVDLEPRTAPAVTPVEEVPIPSVKNLPQDQAPEIDPVIADVERLTAETLGQDVAIDARIGTDTAALRKRLNELNKRIALQQAESLEQQEAARRSGETRRFALGQAAEIQRTSAIEALKLSAEKAALQGEISLASDLAERAVNAEFAQKERDLEIARQNILDNYDTFTAAEKKRADAALLRLDEEDAFVAEQKAERNSVNAIANTAAANNADSETLSRIRNAGSEAEAIQIASETGVLRDPLETRKKELEIQETEIDIATKQAKLAELVSDSEVEDEELNQSENRITELKNKVASYNALLEHGGKGRAVGPTKIARGKLFNIFPILSGQVDDFIATTEQLISQEFLDKLISVKGQGATFGQLSDREGDALRAAATKIGSRRVLNKNGKVMGYDMSEKSFDAEVRKLQNLVSKALRQEIDSAGFDPTLVSEEERADLDRALGEDINPEDFF